MIQAYRACRNQATVRVVDIGCSYGVNAALLRCDIDIDELYRLYGSEQAAKLSYLELLERDRRLFADRGLGEDMVIVGLDAAPRAVEYARRANIIDVGVAVDLETEAPDAECGRRLRGAGLVISTGCIGYVTETSIERLLETCGECKPWMAHFALRMYPFDAIRAALARHGYVTGAGGQTFRQRRFASAEEQEQVIETLIEQGLDPSGLETEGWYHAEFYLSRPAREIGSRPVCNFVKA